MDPYVSPRNTVNSGAVLVVRTQEVGISHPSGTTAQVPSCFGATVNDFEPDCVSYDSSRRRALPPPKNRYREGQVVWSLGLTTSAERVVPASRTKFAVRPRYACAITKPTILCTAVSRNNLRFSNRRLLDDILA